MIRFESASGADIEIIHSLNEQLIRKYEDLSSLDLPSVLAWVHRKLTKQLPEYRAVFRDGEKVGFFHLSETGDGFLELDDLYVLPAFRSQGIGTQVIEYCISESIRLSLPLMLYVFTGNTRAISLYERMGFSLSETVSPTRIIMKRPL